jgi:hypothetical protein
MENAPFYVVSLYIMIFKNLSVALKDTVCTFEILWRIWRITEGSASAVLCFDTHSQQKTDTCHEKTNTVESRCSSASTSRFRPLVITHLEYHCCNLSWLVTTIQDVKRWANKSPVYSSQLNSIWGLTIVLEQICLNLIYEIFGDLMPI